MENKITQEYKDDLYNKVLEKRNIRNKRRKQCLTFCIVFVLFIGIAGFGFSKFKKEDYKNFFRSETENIMINDEYEYFDDLGIKLEFINVDKNSITIGVNIKYENIADYVIDFYNIDLNDVKENYINFGISNNYINNDNAVSIIEYELDNDKVCENCKIYIETIKLYGKKDNSIIEKKINWIKKISIGN